MADYHSEAQNNTGALHENQAVPTPANTVINFLSRWVCAYTMYNMYRLVVPMQVGEEFARQFYHVLTQVPHLAHRFYNDTSKLTYSGGPGPSITVHGQQVSSRVMRSCKRVL